MDRRVKERLVGAAILVVLAVLFVPEFLSGPAKPAPARAAVVTGGIPTTAAAAVRTYTVDLNHPPSEASAVSAPADAPAAAVPMPGMAAPSAAAKSAEPRREAVKIDRLGPAKEDSQADQSPVPAPSAAPAPRESPAALESAPARPQVQALPAAPAKSAVSENSDAPTKPAHSSSNRMAAPAAVKGAWAIQFGSFSSAANAQKLARQLRSKGIQVYVSAVGAKHRVRAGPFADRASADRAAAKLKSQGQGVSIVSP